MSTSLQIHRYTNITATHENKDRKMTTPTPETSTAPTTSKPVVVPTKVDNWLTDRRAALEHLKSNKHDLTLDFLYQNQLPVYVKNMIKTGSVLLCTMIEANGRRSSLRIEKTWIPQRIDSRYSGETLMRSDDLKDLIFRKVITLIHPEDAEKELALPSAQRALLKFKSRFASDIATDRVTEENEENTTTTEKMKVLVNSIKTGKLSQEEGVVEVLDNFISFGEADFHYLYEQFAGKPEFKELVEEIRAEAIRQEKHH